MSVLKKLRTKKGLKLKDVAERMDMLPQQLWSIENGLANVPPHRIGSFSKILGITEKQMIQIVIDYKMKRIKRKLNEQKL